MSTSYLFSEVDFGDFADARRYALAGRIDKLMERHFQAVSMDSLAEDFYNEFSLSIPIMRMEHVFQKKPLSIKIGVDSEYNGKVTRKVEGTRFEIILPFLGSTELLSTRPTKYSYDPPYGQVEQDGIHFIYEVQIFHDNSIIRSSFDQNYLNICSWLENLKTDVEKFNIGLENEIDTALRSRLGGITNTSSAKDVWDFPIR